MLNLSSKYQENNNGSQDSQISSRKSQGSITNISISQSIPLQISITSNNPISPLESNEILMILEKSCRNLQNSSMETRTHTQKRPLNSTLPRRT